MFEASRKRSLIHGAFILLDLIYHNSVRSVRKGHRDAVFAIITSILQNVVMIVAFYFFMDMLGLRRASIRGDFLLYVMSGIFVFMVHIKALSAVAGSEGPTSPMMQHLPMNTTIAIWSAAISALYTQVVTMIFLLSVYHLVWQPLEIHQPVGAAGILLLAWFSGCCFGTVFLAVKPWAPQSTNVVQTVYLRLNMFASGKMFVANQLPANLVLLFSWNPLFHIIDQGRGYIFVNYNPLKSSITYPIVVSLIVLAIGLIGESYTRKRVSLSWAAKS